MVCTGLRRGFCLPDFRVDRMITPVWGPSAARVGVTFAARPRDTVRATACARRVPERQRWQGQPRRCGAGARTSVVIQATTNITSCRLLKVSNSEK